MSWLKNQIRSFLKPESNPTKVIDVKHEKYVDRIVCSREDGIILYAPGTKDQEFYEIILAKPCNERGERNDSNVFRFVANTFLVFILRIFYLFLRMNFFLLRSIYRSREPDEVRSKFDTFKDKLPLLLNLCKDVSLTPCSLLYGMVDCSSVSI
jgi:hypothetical protein